MKACIKAADSLEEAINAFREKYPEPSTMTYIRYAHLPESFTTLERQEQIRVLNILARRWANTGWPSVRLRRTTHNNPDVYALIISLDADSLEVSVDVCANKKVK